MNKTEHFIKTFDEQIKTLTALNCPQAVIGSFLRMKDVVIKKAVGMRSLGEHHIAFLPVIPPAWRSLPDQIGMIVTGNKPGEFRLRSPESIGNRVKTPQRPYYIFAVSVDEIGGVIMNDWKCTCIKQKRSCLTVAESIALCIHHQGTLAVVQRWLLAAGSYVNENSGRWTPVLSVSNDDMPHYFLYEISGGQLPRHYFGASCRYRVAG